MPDIPDINVFYKKSDDYQVLPATGIWGGITPSGQISAEFFVDKPASPEHTVLRTDQAGITTELADTQRRDITREFLVGLIITPDLARVVGNWFINKADEYEKLTLGGKK